MKGKRPIKLFTKREHFYGIAIILATSGYTEKGVQLWKDVDTDSFFKSPEFGNKFNISYTQFEEWKKLFIYSFVDPDIDKSDPWWRVRDLIDEYNKNRQENVAAGIIKVLDESMSAWCPQTTKTGRLPHLSFIL